MKSSHLIAIFCLLMTLGLSACGGGGGSSDTPTTNTNTNTTVSGIVADGYLSGARVFLDRNNNRRFDDGEPNAITADDGSYNLTIDENDNDHPVVVQVLETTVDQDTNKPVSRPYVLISPPGHPEFISPLTTLMQVCQENNPDIDPLVIEDFLKKLFGFDNEDADIDLFSDYISKKGNAGEQSANYAKLHNIAQLVARLAGDINNQINTAISQTSLNVDQVKASVLRITLNEILQYMSLIEDTASDSTDFNADAEVQTLSISVDTAGIVNKIENNIQAFLHEAPSHRWVGVFRNVTNAGTEDRLTFALDYKLDKSLYKFSVEGPDGTYTFNDVDQYEDPDAAMAWSKPCQYLPEGEYKFYITVPSGEKIEVDKKSFTHKGIQPLETNSFQVVNTTGSYSRVYYDPLEGNYYYRIAVRDKDTKKMIYKSHRRAGNIQYFPSEYSTSNYEYRIEAWDKPLSKDSVTRYVSDWSVVNPLNEEPTDTYIVFFKGYHRRFNNYDEGSGSVTLDRVRDVLQIGITNPDDIVDLKISDPNGNEFTYNLDAPDATSVGYESGAFGSIVSSQPKVYVTKTSRETSDGTAYNDYYLSADEPMTGTYTWQCTTASGNDFTRTVTLYEQNELPYVDPESVRYSVDTHGTVTFDWDAVSSNNENQRFYQVVIYPVTDGVTDRNHGYWGLRVPRNKYKVDRDELETKVGYAIDSENVKIAVRVTDSQSAETVQNMTECQEMALH